jgi:hypothetical protein
MTQPTYDPSEYPGASYVTITVEDNSSIYDTLNDWNLVLTHVSIDDADARRFEVTVPGRDGTLDLSSALGGIYYENRQITLEFACKNYIAERFNLLASTMRNALDGKICRAILSNDSSYFWRGRPQVSVEWGGLNHTVVVVTIMAEPYKYSISSSYDPWLWSPFSFVNGVIVQEADIVLNNQTVEHVLPADRARGKPTIWLNRGSVQVKLSTMSTWLTLKAGANVFPEIRMDAQNAQTLQLKGTGTVGLDYRLGSL